MRLSLSGLLPEDGVVSFYPQEKLNLLATSWARVFNATPIGDDFADELNSSWTRPVAVDGISTPDAEDNVKASAKAKNSSPGPDDIYYVAWAAVGSRGD